MNKKPLKPCNYPTCPKLTQGRYCEDHVYTRDKPARNARKMGYDKNWEKARIAHLQQHPLCVYCLQKNPPEYTVATVVDHSIPHKGSYKIFWDKTKWVSSCTTCHNRKTASEDMGWWDTSKGLR